MRTIFGILAESFFPCKLVTLGITLILLGLFIPSSMLAQITQESFVLLFLAYAAVITGFLVCVIGCTSNMRANRP